MTLLIKALSLALALSTANPNYWQSVVDDPNRGLLFWEDPYHLIIADHSTQGFADLPDIEIGERALLRWEDGTVTVYSCVDIQPGYNDGAVRYSDGTSAADVYDLMCYTCTENGVIIVGFDRVETRRTETCPKLMPQ